MRTLPMKMVCFFVILSLLVAFTPSYAGDVGSDDEEQAGSGGTSKVLTGALLGGLLGGGIGTAIGSASGHAGTGALVGAGVGAASGAVVGAASEDSSRSGKKASKKERDDTAVPKGEKVKKRVIREYDEEGNVISEKEVKE